MPLADEQSRARMCVRAKRGAPVLAALVEGASFDEIADSERLSPKRVEKALRDELRRRWSPGAEDFARLQIARLDSMTAKLAALAENGSLPAIDLG